MKTASFFTYPGPGGISIARYAPKGTPRSLPVFKELAPGTWFRSVTPARYVDRFAKEVLARLEPKSVAAQLLELSAGAEPVLLCWERPTDRGAWCHRRIVADWFEQALSQAVPEWGYEQAEIQPLAIPLTAARS